MGPGVGRISVHLPYVPKDNFLPSNCGLVGAVATSTTLVHDSTGYYLEHFTLAMIRQESADVDWIRVCQHGGFDGLLRYM